MSSQADNLEALLKVQDNILNTFESAGCERIAPEIIQPADVFLNQSGEEMRQRTYVFTDPHGTELCLRPDVTIPACRIYLQRFPQADQPARYCYVGPAFRFQPSGHDEARPREFEQAGVELLQHGDKQAAEAEVLSLSIRAIEAAGIDSFAIRFGDLSLFASLIDGLDMPDRWRVRLKHHFWRHDALDNLLLQLSSTNRSATPYDTTLIDRLSDVSLVEATEIVDTHLVENNLPVVGRRSVEDIVTRLMDHVADRDAAPLDAEIVAIIKSYLSINAHPDAAHRMIGALADKANLDLSDTLDAFARRLDLFKELKINLDRAEFCAEFGRNLEYYTGFVFQLEVPEAGAAGQIAGGGRYDNLLAGLGAPQPVPAVGCAIHLERLLQTANSLKTS